MGLEKLGASACKNIGSLSGSVTKPVKLSAGNLKLAEPLAQDTVEIANKGEIAKECFYDKVKNWHPCEDMLKSSPEVYDIPKDYWGTGHIYIDRVVVGENQSKGTGTRTMQKIVRESLADPDCQGRIRFNAMTIDIKRGSPVGFHYKLGFRAEDPRINKKFEQWLAEGAPKDKRPFCLAVNMYLPKENIEQCLNYGK